MFSAQNSVYHSIQNYSLVIAYAIHYAGFWGGKTNLKKFFHQGFFPTDVPIFSPRKIFKKFPYSI
ncbi:hypothetical protein DRQ26_04255, partial [bacterium]